MSDMSDKMTMKRACELALFAQDACNLSGVVHSFSDILSNVIWPMAREQNKGTTWVNTHPVSVLFAYKICALSGWEPIYHDKYEESFAWCNEQAGFTDEAKRRHSKQP